MANYDFTDLVLLIGTNPLPNYVVSEYYISTVRKLKNIWLVHSEDTSDGKDTLKQAEILQKVLQDEYQTRIHVGLIALEDVSSADKIQKNLRSKLIPKLREEQGVFHLNYTGGTKAMAVHVYRVLESELQDKCSFSYLDARDYKIKDDREGPVTEDLRDIIVISLDRLMELHKLERHKSKEEFNPEWPEIIQMFKKLIDEGKLDIYLTWARTFLTEKYFNSDGFISVKNKFLEHNKIRTKMLSNNEYQTKKVEEIKSEFIQKTLPEVLNILQAVPLEYSLLEMGELWIPCNGDTNSQYEKRLKPTVKNFLHGKWLEVYVRDVLKKYVNADPVLKGREDIPIELGRHIINSEYKQETEDFELDVILINGCHVCGISCTTDETYSLCKSKGFEVLHRVQQIGGDESKAVLVTALTGDKVKKLRNDLSSVTGTTDKNLLILGEKQLNESILWEKIKNYIWVGR